MKLFGKKKETKACCCGGSRTSETMQKTENKRTENCIKILGSGCAKCMELEKATRTAIAELSFNYEIDHVTDFAEIASYGVMSTPALVLNGKVISYGKVLTAEEVKELLLKQ
jgi:small redox-active disulfide protein 2